MRNASLSTSSVSYLYYVLKIILLFITLKYYSTIQLMISDSFRVSRIIHTALRFIRYPNKGCISHRRRVSHRRVSKRGKSDVSRHRQPGWKKSLLRSFCVIARPTRVVTRANPGRVSNNAPTLPLIPSPAQAPSEEEAYEIPPTAFPRLLLRPLQVSFPIPFLPPPRPFSLLPPPLPPRCRLLLLLIG